MRFLMVSPHYVPAYHYGGALYVAHSLGKSLVSQGHEVRVCTTNLRNPTEDLEVPVDAPVMVDGVQVCYEPTVFSRYWGFSPRMVRRIWTESHWADIVVIHFHYQFASLIAGWVCRVRRKPYVIFSHGTLNKYGVKARSRMKKLLYLNLLERQNFRQALFTAYHSQEEVEISYRFGRYNLVANGIDANSFKELPQANNFRKHYPSLKNAIVVLFLGRLAPGKGLDLLLPAFRRLSEAFGETHLVLAGGNELDYETEVRGMLRDLGLANRVTLTGLITGQEKLAALQDADIFVMPSRSEGVSIATLEAMYMGLPVIVTDRVGISPEVEKNLCGLVVPYDEDSLAGALQQLSMGPDRRDMGQRGRQLVDSRYTTDTTARHLVAAIEEALAS
jgi:glycosyltransferase involved in cell wall biosynthesis